MNVFHSQQLVCHHKLEYLWSGMAAILSRIQIIPTLLIFRSVSSSSLRTFAKYSFSRTMPNNLEWKGRDASCSFVQIVCLSFINVNWRRFTLYLCSAVNFILLTVPCFQCSITSQLCMLSRLHHDTVINKPCSLTHPDCMPSMVSTRTAAPRFTAKRLKNTRTPKSKKPFVHMK